MDALVPAFIVALLAETGDRTQLLAILLAKKFGKPGLVIAGIALAALLNTGLGAAAGVGLGLEIDHQIVLLMTGFALFFAGIGGLFRAKPPEPVDNWRLGALVSSFGAFFILALFDKTQFLAATLSGASGGPVLTAIGAAAGVTVANIPAVVLQDRWPQLVPLRAIRLVCGGLLMLAGLYMVLSAFGLI